MHMYRVHFFHYGVAVFNTEICMCGGYMESLSATVKIIYSATNRAKTITM